MFSYKTAVAVQALGYQNIKIYNGGIKDWKKSGLALEAARPLPEAGVQFIAADRLRQRLEASRENGCTTADGTARVTILDFRNENRLDPGHRPPRIRSDCPTRALLLDDLQDPGIRSSIPKHGWVVTISETGNRDAYAMRYLSQFGFTNIRGLQFGMRSWIKLGYPTEPPTAAD